jgi:hypothetical protein
MKNALVVLGRWKFLLGLSLTLDIACQPTGSPSPDLTEVVRATLPFTIEGTPYAGTAVVQRRTYQKITVSVPAKSVKLMVQTCHREEVWDRPPEKFEWAYIPASFIENWGACPMTISIITEQGALLQAMIDFSSNETLPAVHYCNGQRILSPLGVSLCQAREGLVQRITFDERVEGVGGAGCGAIKQDGFSWNYTVSRGMCVYAFRSSVGKFHRLTTRGYSSLGK